MANATQDLSDEAKQLGTENENLKKQISTLENDIDSTREDYERQLKNLEASKETEIDRIMEATKNAIGRKDDQIERLEVKIDELEHRLHETDAMLAQQAHELLDDDDD